MRYIVGYQMTEDDRFIRQIIAHRESVREVYFSWGDFPNGRSSLLYDDGKTLFEKQARQAEDLRKLSSAGIGMNVLFNGNCYGKDSQSREFFHKIGNTISYIGEKFGVSSVTTSSPLIARFTRENFSGIDVRASVNMEIGSIEGIEYVANIFDSFYVQRERNRDLTRLGELKDWCEKNGKRMYLLANSGCLNFCSAHTFHDNLVAHESEISAMDNGYQFRGICWDYFKNRENLSGLLERTNFIRPEDIALYEPYTDAVKLATRVNKNPTGVLEAYVRGSFSGSLQSLLEPDHSGALYPLVLENGKIPKDFGKKVSTCNHHCENCGYCKKIFEQATINIGGIASYVNESND